MRVKHRKSLSEQVRVVQRKQYSTRPITQIACSRSSAASASPAAKYNLLTQSIDFSLLTSEHRKDLFFKMIKKYVASIEKE